MAETSLVMTKPCHLKRTRFGLASDPVNLRNAQASLHVMTGVPLWRSQPLHDLMLAVKAAPKRQSAACAAGLKKPKGGLS